MKENVKRPRDTVTQKNGKIVTYFSDNSLWKKSYAKGKSVWGINDIKNAKKFIPNADIVIDVGANIGQETIYYSDWAKNVYSFEPATEAFEVLSLNVQQNGIENATLCNFGLSSEALLANLHVFKGNEGMAYVTTEKTKLTESVYLVKFDDFVNTHIQSGKIDFIKIDVEGHELEVLLGMTETIQKHSPIFQIELKDKWLARVGISSLDIWDFFHARGYDAYLNPSKKLCREDVPSEKRRKVDLFFKRTA